MELPKSEPPGVPLFLSASNRIMRSQTFKLRATEIREIPVLAEGYALFTHCRDMDPALLSQQLTPILTTGKTIVLTEVSAPVMTAVRDLLRVIQGIRIIQVSGDNIHLLSPATISIFKHDDDSIVFLVSENFLLRRYLHQRVQKQNIVFPGQDRLPPQFVRFVGLGPIPELVSSSAAEAVRNSQHVVLFDRTLQNIVGGLVFGGERYVVRYNYEDFSANLFAINMMLGSLHVSGVLDVTVLIEGNPEVYDFAEGLSTAGRVFSFEPTEPLVVLGCHWVEAKYELDFVRPSYILTSGCNVRHGITTTSALTDITSVLDTELSCMAMEMYIGDIPLVLDAVASSQRRKSIIVLTNMYSPQQRVFFLPFERLRDVEWVVRIKGLFTTFVIVDEARLAIDSPAYKRLTAEIGPGTAPITPASTQEGVFKKPQTP